MQIKLASPARLARGLWWDRAWSLIDGCTNVSAECKNCWLAADAYMRGKQRPGSPMQKRFDGITKPVGGWSGMVVPRPERLKIPLETKRPSVWSIWSDLFHEKVPGEFILEALTVMRSTDDRHHYIVLTKREMRAAQFLALPDNMTLGTTIGAPETAGRALAIAESRAKSKFLSVEPLLGPCAVPVPVLAKFDWVLIGGESGHHARPCRYDDVMTWLEACKAANVPAFVKQLGAKFEPAFKSSTRKRWKPEEWPPELQVRQLPKGAGK